MICQKSRSSYVREISVCCLFVVTVITLLGGCASYVGSWFNLCHTVLQMSKDLTSCFKFYAGSKVSELIDNLKTLCHAKTADVDRVLHGWFMQYVDEKFPLCHYVVVSQT
jgi:hypothetical protein